MAATSITATLPIVTVFKSLPARDQIRLFAQMAHEFSWLGYAFDHLDSAIDGLAAEMASNEGWRGDDLAARYLAPDWPSMGLAPVVQVAA